MVSKKNNVKRYFPPREIARFLFFSVTLTCIKTSTNFLYGRQKIHTIALICILTAIQIFSFSSLLHSIYQRLKNTQNNDQLSKKLDDLIKDKNFLQNKETIERSTLITILSRHMIVVMVSCSFLRCISFALSISAPILYKGKLINITSYILMVLSSYIIITTITTLFTLDRVLNRTIKKDNHKKILLIINDSNQPTQLPNRKLGRIEKLEVAIHFIVDSVVWSADLACGFLYGAKAINDTSYIIIMLLLYSLTSGLAIQSVYDRFSSLEELEKDKQLLEQELGRSNSVQTKSKDNSVVTRMTIFVTVAVATQALYIAGRIAVSFLYKQDRISTAVYLASTFLTIFFGYTTSLILSIHRVLDDDITKDIGTTLDNLPVKEQHKIGKEQ